MRDGKKVAPHQIRQNRQKTGTGFALSNPIEKQPDRFGRIGILRRAGRLGTEEARVFRGKPHLRNRSFARIVHNYMTKVVVA
jgi:hypothetical protein